MVPSLIYTSWFPVFLYFKLNKFVYEFKFVVLRYTTLEIRSITGFLQLGSSSVLFESSIFKTFHANSIVAS